MMIFCDRPTTGITLAISKYTAAAQRGIAPGAGAEGLSISDEERRRILAEEQKQLDRLKVWPSHFSYAPVLNVIGKRHPGLGVNFHVQSFALHLSQLDRAVS
jgi:hypothetical protein